MMTPPILTLKVLSLRYSSWSMRPWLVLTHAGVDFQTETVSLPHMMDPSQTTSMEERRQLGSVQGLFPVLEVTADDNDDGSTGKVHESLAICEYVADLWPEAHLWPKDPLARARARAVCCEMLSGFSGLRGECSCNLFARVPSFQPTPHTQNDIDRVFEIWTDCLERAGGGPYLFGIADAMYYPVVTRLRTYGIELPTERLKAYVEAIEATPVVVKLVEMARKEPGIPTYDAYIRGLGGDPNKEL
jgi:glutathione S-transferase